MAPKTRSLKRIFIRIAIILATCAAALGILRAIQCYAFYDSWVFTGYGFEESDHPLEKITGADLAVVHAVLSSNGISYKLSEEGNVVFVRPYNWKKATDLLQNCDYEFDGCALS